MYTSACGTVRKVILIYVRQSVATICSREVAGGMLFSKLSFMIPSWCYLSDQVRRRSFARVIKRPLGTSQ